MNAIPNALFVVILIIALAILFDFLAKYWRVKQEIKKLTQTERNKRQFNN
jgi:uncharacterized membrane protein